jgi:hypothetical protein
MVDLREFERIAREEFADIVIDVYRIDVKLRVHLIDESYLDFWWSEVQAGRFAHHWHRKHVDGTIYRHDNSPHRRWQHIETFPQHYHQGGQRRAQKASCQRSRERLFECFSLFVGR